MIEIYFPHLNGLEQQIEFFYENGFFVGAILWYNRGLQEFRVYYDADNSDDYISLEDINWIEVVLLMLD